MKKLRATALVLALAAPGLAWGQDSLRAERIARLSYVEGEVTFQAAGRRPTGTLPKRPLEPGDSLRTGRDARAELALGIATLRIDEHSELAIVELDAEAARVELARGTASVYLDELLEDESFEVLTPNTSIALTEPGEYRVDVGAGDASALTVHAGAAQVETAAGPILVAAGQRVQVDGRDAIARLETPRMPDAFDDWVLERELLLAEAQPPRYTPYEGARYDDLDRYGEWYDDPYYGRVWMPGYGYSDWSPYYGGYWQRTGFGWSWFDPAPWGYFSYYGGRWTYLHDRSRWCWVPTRHRPRHFPRDHETPESAPRTASWYPRQPRTVEPSSPIATPTVAPQRIDTDRRPTRANGDANARPSRPAAAPPSNSGAAAVQPSRPERARAVEDRDRGQGRMEPGVRQEP